MLAASIDGKAALDGSELGDMYGDASVPVAVADLQRVAVAWFVVVPVANGCLRADGAAAAGEPASPQRRRIRPTGRCGSTRPGLGGCMFPPGFPG
jgi:hypothetical protein